MPARGNPRLLSSWRGRSSNGPQVIFRRPASTAAAVAIEPTSTSNVAESPRLAYQLRAGIVLSRPPLITRDLHPFEKAFYLYQRRLNERLAIPFTRYFYYRKDTPASIEYKRKIQERKTPARDIGFYDAYGPEGWNDELLMGAPESEPEHQMEALLKDAQPDSTSVTTDEVAAEAKPQEVSIPRPMPRVTKADETGDQKSLDRMLQRSLYLLVANAEGRWAFPSAPIEGRETLRQAAERILTQTGGEDMNTWIVGNQPIGHIEIQHAKPRERPASPGTIEQGERTFFVKGRIMAGQANITQNKFGVKDYKWLSREEIQGVVHPRYWSKIQGMLPQR